MISGAHCMIYSTDAEADRDFFRDVLGLPHIDTGGGWLIFSLPSTELAVHPTESGFKHELYLMCEDLDAVVESLEQHGIGHGDISRQSWGRAVGVSLPSGAMIGLYQPAHPRAAGAE
jgi:catechol 2,3-dioxygenase-like lactoylglutathione lyase family enzyme